MKPVTPAPEPPNGLEESTSGTLSTAFSTEMFEPIRGIDPDFGPTAPLGTKSASWRFWLQPNKFRH